MKFYSDGMTVAAIGDTVAYLDTTGDNAGDSNISRIAEFLPAGDGADVKLVNGCTAIIGNCKRLATAHEVN